MLKALFSDSGEVSSQRVVFLFTWLGIPSAILGVWGYASYKAAVMANIPDSVITMASLLLYGSGASKVIQFFKEKDAKECKPSS